MSCFYCLKVLHLLKEIFLLLCKCFFLCQLKDYETKKRIVASSLLLSLCLDGEICTGYAVFFLLKEDIFIGFCFFLPVPCSTTNHGIQLRLGIYQGGNRDTLLMCSFQALANLRSPVSNTWCPMIQQRLKSHSLNRIDPQLPPSSTYKIT